MCLIKKKKNGEEMEFPPSLEWHKFGSNISIELFTLSSDLCIQLFISMLFIYDASNK